MLAGHLYSTPARGRPQDPDSAILPEMSERGRECWIGTYYAG
jgi:hypothetical protein